MLISLLQEGHVLPVAAFDFIFDHAEACTGKHSDKAIEEQIEKDLNLPPGSYLAYNRAWLDSFMAKWRASGYSADFKARKKSD
jgi:hypothetical protein